ncbi:RNA polymerase rbpN/10 [Pandoravirus dulcis]|uniref:DNA-directed RNA polymerase RPB10 homolog n=1 Tax=Pandoravirus dulcis TaxID=1349409 RepID=S4VXQ0_9VIRU|nr:RNA polymerase rbpN/10 [Pandoravirus dulcis]AGO82669.1 RNA polymerase rbpN/10 [Pandoravirus dulcis]
MIPVRCFTCGFVLGNLERPYQRLLRDMPAGAALDALGLTSDRRDCCRWVMLTYVDVTEAVLDFEHANALKAPDDTSHEYVTVHGPGPMRRPGGGGDDDGGDDDNDDDRDSAVGYGGLRHVPSRSGSRCRRDCLCCPRIDAATASEQRRRRRIILAR